ncbi:MAG: DNA replication/repair protein RecF [Leptospiraceae bacterium]|nr:DNA replication/repair protein RecF [Leptospiraceae bacterium]
MNLLSLQLRDFRTYANLNLRFPARLTFLTGPNANGKTNILEAVGILSLGKSFRGATDADMAHANEGHYYISGSFEKQNRMYDLSVGVELSGSKIKRKISLNDKTLSSRQQLIGRLVTVIMSPTDILISDGGPAHRRRFLDMVLSYQNPEYLNNLITYNRALRQRNALLKKIKSQKARLADLDVWTAPLADYAHKITRARLQFATDFDQIFAESLERISGGRDRLIMRLALSAGLEAENPAAAIQKYVSRDLALGYTTVGPHRQNLMFEKNDADITRFGSQGQKRSLVLALRIAQFSYLQKTLKLAPILLIDDVIRELDGGRRGAFVQLLRECGQAIFTTPDLDGLMISDERIRSDMAVYEVDQPGSVNTSVPI